MPRNTTVNLVSEKGRKLTAEEHDETIGNLKQTADEAHDLASAALPANGTALDSAKLQGKQIGGNPGDVMTVGAFGVGSNITSLITNLNTYFSSGWVCCLGSAVGTPGSSEGWYVSYAGWATSAGGYQIAVGANTGRLYVRTRLSSMWQEWSEVAFLDSAQTLTNKKVSFQNLNDVAANILDWYEEGSFTPYASGEPTAGEGVYGAQVGRYTRIGNIVHFTAYIVCTAHTGSGSLQIRGLPFIQNSSVSDGCVVGYARELGFTHQIAAWVAAITNRIDVWDLVPNGTPLPVQIKSSFRILISGSYRV